MKKILAFVLTLALVLSLVGCSTESAPAAESTQANTSSSGEQSSQAAAPSSSGGEQQATEGKAKKDTLIIAQAADITSTDPLRAVNTYSISVNRHVYDYLINLNEDGTYSPMLAESWSLVNPNLVELKLRQDVTFHNGEHMTSEDVVYSLSRARDLPLSLIQGMFGEITAVDDYTVHVELLQTFGAIELLFCRTGTQIVCKSAMEADYDNFVQNAPIGTGPYKFVSWSKGDSIVLEGFDDYWGGAPNTKNLIIRVIAEPSQRLIALENGEIDIAYDIGPNDVAKIQENPELAIVIGPSSRCVILSTNYADANSPIANNLVLQAMQYAIDKQLIVDAVGYGHGIVAHTLIPSFAFGSTESIQTEYNPEKAKELLAQAGYPNGFEVELSTYSDQLYSEIASVLQSQLAEVGITLNIQVSDQATLLEYCADKSHGLVLKFWMTVADAHNTFQPYYFSTSSPSHGNSAFYQNPEFDKWVTVESNSADSEVRKQAFEELHKIAAEDLPYIPIYFTPMLVGHSADTEGFVPDPYGYHRLNYITVYE